MMGFIWGVSGIYIVKAVEKHRIDDVEEKFIEFALCSVCLYSV